MKNDGQWSLIAPGRSGGMFTKFYLFIMLFFSVSSIGCSRGLAVEDLSYHTYDTMLSELRQLEKDHPKRGKLHDLGLSSDGRTRVWAFKISDNVEKEEDEPNVLLTGGVHGNERVASEMALFTIRRLLSENSRRDLIDKTQIWVIPILNPAGYKANYSHCNANKVDLNRNFPTHWTSDDLDAVEIEIQNLVRNFLLRRDHIVAGIDLHTYGRAYLLPWANTQKKPADWDALKDLGDKMAKTSGYRAMQLTDYLHRTVPGGAADYLYGRYGTFYYGLELGTSHALPAEQLGGLCRKNLAGIMIMMNRVHTRALTGHVTRNGKPAAAVVDVDGIDKPDNLRRPYMSDAAFGRYYRILLPGVYTIRFTFERKKIVKENVIIVDDRQTVLDIEFP
jgi:succinylglutamate desuccinylase